jgi:hypothetical protein
MLDNAPRLSFHVKGIDIQIVRHPANRDAGRFANTQQFDLFTPPIFATGSPPIHGNTSFSKRAITLVE